MRIMYKQNPSQFTSLIDHKLHLKPVMITLHQQQKERKTNGFPIKQTKKCKHNIQLSSPQKFVQTRKSTKEGNKHACIACLQLCSLGFCMFCRKQLCEKKAEKERE
jgi:hypothetical protein